MDDVRLTHSLVAAGSTHYALRVGARDGSLAKVRRGAWASEPAPDPVQAHRRLIAATLAQTHPGAVVSHVSAGAVHWLPVAWTELGRVHVTRDREGGGQCRAWLQVHGHPLPDEHVTVVDGVPVTTLERTAVDLATCLPLRDAVAVGDAALRRGASRTGMLDVLSQIGKRKGIASARRAVELLDASRESYGESVSRVVLAEHLLAAPLPQVLIFDRADALVGRTDFAWPSLGVVGEFDGRVKYGRELADGQDVAEVLWREKLREDALRELGWLVVRWVWSDLEHPEAWLARLGRALEQGRRRPPPAGSWRLAARPA